MSEGAMAWISIGLLIVLGLWGLLDLFLSSLVLRIHRRRQARIRRIAGIWSLAPLPLREPLREQPEAVLGFGVGAAAGALLSVLGLGGIWPLFLPGLGLALGALARTVRGWGRSVRHQAAVVAVLEELALQLAATGSLEAALRRVGDEKAAWPEEGELRRKLQEALDEAVRQGRGGLEALENWARRTDPSRLMPVAAVVAAAAAGGRRPEEALLTVADDAAEEISQELAGRLRALPDRLLPVVGLGMFAPILGLVLLPVAAYLLRLITASATRLNIPVP
jgi:pilus assembly protein TadC